MNTWLQNLAYRIEIAWWVFLLAGGLALGIALVTVSTQAIKAALRIRWKRCGMNKQT